MKKINKTIVVALMICILIITCVLLNQEKSNNTADIKKDISINNNYKFDQVLETKKTYNIQRVIDNIIENVYDGVYPSSYPIDINTNSIKSFDIEENLKNFYIEKAYEVTISETTEVYCVKGYLIIDGINNYQGDIEKQEAQFILVRYINNNDKDRYVIGKYGSSFNNTFEYNDNDISKTRVVDLGDNEIELNLITDNMLFEGVSLDEDVPEVNLAYWYYDDYKNNKLFSDHNKEEYENTELFKYEGNMEKGFTLIDNNEKQIIIKPGSVPMEYEVEEK